MCLDSTSLLKTYENFQNKYRLALSKFKTHLNDKNGIKE